VPTQANRTFMMSCIRETLSILVFDYFRNRKSMELLAAFALQPMQLFAELSKMQRAFPDLLALLKVILTIPVASASAERSFSAMRRVKSHLRASMSASRTSDLTLITVERELSGAIFHDPGSAIDKFASMGPRRLTLK